MHVEAVANGLGGQSIYLLWLACQKKIPATVSVTADTGWENDCLWNTGERTSAHEYYERIVVPLASKYGIDSYFVRATDKNGNPLPTLREATIQQAQFLADNDKNCLKIPLYGSRNGQLRQSCTQRWKIAALCQQLRRCGARTARTAQGIHVDEFMRRARGEPLGRDEQGFMVYQSGKYDKVKRMVEEQDLFGTKMIEVIEKVWKPQKWLTHYYPLVGLKMNREQVRQELEGLEIPYLLSTECDGCPHKDPARWKRTSLHVIQDLTMIETGFEGKFFFTHQRRPLNEVVATHANDDSEVDFGCENDICGI